MIQDFSIDIERGDYVMRDEENDDVMRKFPSGEDVVWHLVQECGWAWADAETEVLRITHEHNEMYLHNDF